MPWKSKKQAAWGNSDAGKEAMGEEAVDEFNKATDGIKLPNYADHMKKHKHISSIQQSQK